MESRKMVLMNLFAEHRWRHRHSEQTYGPSCGGKEKVGGMEREIWKHTLPYLKLIANRICFMTQGTKTRAGNSLQWWGGVVGGREVQVGGNMSQPMAYSC